MKAWNLFLKDVLPYVPGCPEPVAEHAVMRAAQEFFDTTRLWKLWLIDLTTEADRTDYILLLEPHSELVRLETAILDGREIEVRSQDQLPGDWRANPQALCTGVHFSGVDSLTLLPAQAADLTLSVEASLKPSESAAGIGDEFFARCVKPIACGAVAALKEHAEKSYSDPVGATDYRGRFEGEMSSLEFRRHRGFSSARPRRQIKTF